MEETTTPLLSSQIFFEEQTEQQIEEQIEKLFCRICYVSEGELYSLKCGCKNNYVHFDCAFKWYTPKTKVTLSGYMNEEAWTFMAECFCEICKGSINQNLLNKFIDVRNPKFISRTKSTKAK